MEFKNKAPAFLPGTTAPANQVIKFMVVARIQPAPGGFAIRPIITAQDAAGNNVNPPSGFVVPADVQKAYQEACEAAVDACAAKLSELLRTYGYNS